MKSHTVVSLVLALNTCTLGFAACETEKKEREQSKEDFDKASKVAAATCATGSLFSIATGGLSLLPCAAAGLTAENQRRILGEKESNLLACENENLRLQKLLAQQALERKARIDSIHLTYNTKREQIIRDYELKNSDLMHEFEISGFDLTHPDIQLDIKEKQSALQVELNQELKKNESERARSLVGV